jgi:hypothetical protein
MSDVLRFSSLISENIFGGVFGLLMQRNGQNAIQQNQRPKRDTKKAPGRKKGEDDRIFFSAFSARSF